MRQRRRPPTASMHLGDRGRKRPLGQPKTSPRKTKHASPRKINKFLKCPSFLLYFLLQHVLSLRISFRPSLFPSSSNFSTSSMYYSWPSFRLYSFLRTTSAPSGGKGGLGHLESLLGHLETLLGHLATLLEYLETLLGHLETLLDHLET